MNNMFTSIPLSIPQTPGEITRYVKQRIQRPSSPNYQSTAKVKRRTSTNLAFVRNPDDWKKNFERRDEQKFEGCSSIVTRPYSELGKTELVANDLVINALTGIGGVLNNQV